MLNACAASAPPSAADLDAIEAELATLEAQINAATHRKLELIRLVDSSGLWAHQGCRSCAHWLSWRLQIDIGSAREQVRVARCVEELPAIDEELRHARLTYSQVRAMTRVATPENEARLVEIAKHSTAAQLEHVVRGVRRADPDGDPTAPPPPERWVRERPMPDGSVRVEAQLGPDEAALVMEAIRTMRAAMRAEQRSAASAEPAASGPSAPAASGDGSDDAQACPSSEPAAAASTEPEPTAADGAAEPAPSRAPSFADALVRIAEEVGAGALEPGTLEPGGRASASRTGGERTSLVVHLGPDALEDGFAAQLDDGSRVSAETFRRLACDCGLITVSEDERGEPLDVGRKTRSIPPALRRAVMLRDRGCVFPGCTHDRFVDCHHIEHWAHGGGTDKDNLVSLCTFHHRLLHEGGWKVRWDLDRDLQGSGDASTRRGGARSQRVARFITPDGHALPACHAAPPSQDGGALLERLLRDQLELGLDDETAYPQWDGRVPDYDACVKVICAPHPKRETFGPDRREE